MSSSHNQSVNQSLSSTARDDFILEQLRSAGRVEITDLAEHLGVSEMTVRRDLDRLAGDGRVRRVRGGAVAVGPAPFAQRYAQQAKAKDVIATKLLGLVGDGGAVGMDASTTIQRLAHRVGEIATDLTILTNGPETFLALRDHPGVTAILTGGQFDKRTGGLVGPVAIRSTNEMVLRDAFISSAALNPTIGTSEQTLEDSETKTAIVNASSTVTLAVDHSKLDSHASVRGLELNRVDRLVTDLDPSDARLDPYRGCCSIF